MAVVLRCGEHMRRYTAASPRPPTAAWSSRDSAIQALAAITRSCEVELTTDSQYVQRGISEYLPKWKLRGWRTSQGPVKNRDLWEMLDAQLQRHRVTILWVRGHADHTDNCRCDELAGQERRRLIESIIQLDPRTVLPASTGPDASDCETAADSGPSPRKSA